MPRLAGQPSTAVVAAIIFAVSLAAFARIPLLPEIGRDLSLTAGEIGLLTTAFGLGRLLTDLPAGRLADAVAPTVGLTGAGLLLMLSCALLAAAGSLGVALAASALIGCASALTNTTGMYVFASAADARRRGASMAIYVTAIMSGQMAGPAIGGALGSLAGWREAIAASAAIGAGVAAVCAALWWRAHAVPPAGARAGRSHAATGDPPASPAPRRELFALALAPFATFFGMAGLTQTLIPLIGDGELDLSASTIGLAIGAGAALRFFSAWVAGVTSDRLSRRIVLVPSLALMAVAGAVLALASSVLTWSASILLLALGSSGVSVAAAAVADRVPAPELGRELGLFRLLGDLGLVVGPLVAGFIYQASGPRLAGLVTAAVFAAAALAAAVWVAETPPPGRRAEDTGEVLLE
jgi:MFS family permease